MDTIKHLLEPKVCGIKKAENEMAQLTYETYAIIKNKIEDIIDMEWAT